MPSKYPVLSPGEVIRILERAGFSFVSQRGSHMKYSDGVHTVIVPNHNKDIYIGTLQSIIRQSGMTVSAFLSHRE